MKRVLVAGGSESYVFSSLAPKLAEHDVHVSWHWEYKAQDALPVGCGGVINLRFTNHPLMWDVKALAKKAHVPFAHVGLEWTKALPILRLFGILPSPVVQETPPSEDDVYETIVTFIDNETQRGRRPSWGETLMALRKAYGPSVHLYQRQYQRALSLVASKKFATIEAEKDTTVIEQSSEVHEWAKLFIEDCPESSIEDIAKRVQGQSPGISSEEARNAAICARNELLNEWIRISSTSVPTTDKTRLMRMKHAWVMRQLHAAQAAGKPLPKFAVLQTESTLIFGRQVSTATLTIAFADFRKGKGKQVPPKPVSAPQPAVLPESERIALRYKQSNYSQEKVRGTINKVRQMSLATPTELTAFHGWVQRLDQNPATPINDVAKKILSPFAGRQADFTAAFMLLVKDASPIIQATVHNAYRCLTGRGLGPDIARFMAYEIGYTFQTLPKNEAARRAGKMRGGRMPAHTPDLSVLIAEPTLPLNGSSPEEVMAISTVPVPVPVQASSNTIVIDVAAVEGMLRAGFTVTLDRADAPFRIVIEPKKTS